MAARARAAFGSGTSVLASGARNTGACEGPSPKRPRFLRMPGSVSSWVSARTGCTSWPIHSQSAASPATRKSIAPKLNRWVSARADIAGSVLTSASASSE